MYAIKFVRESNLIEGIDRLPTPAEVDEHDRFIHLDALTVNEVIRFVNVYEPKAKLRDQFGMNVRVGNHKPPIGNPNIKDILNDLLGGIGDISAYRFHNLYETLHPFTDCNGRSGRAVWAWMMYQDDNIYRSSFLHEYYYQSLHNWRELK